MSNDPKKPADTTNDGDKPVDGELSEQDLAKVSGGAVSRHPWNKGDFRTS